MKKVFLFAGIGLALVGAAVVLLWSNLNTIIEKGIESFGPKVLLASVAVKSVDLKVTEGSGAITGVTIGNPKGFQSDYAFKLGSVAVALDPASVTSDTVHIKSIVINASDIVYEGLGGKSNLEQLQANAQAYAGDSKGKQEASGQNKKVVIDSLKIENGQVNLSAALLQGKKLTVPLPPIELHDIGKKKGATMADALDQTLAAINRAALPAAQKGMASLGEGVKEVGKSVQEEATKGVEGIKGLFGK